MSQLVEDLDFIGHLDFAPVCDPADDQCDQTATWWISVKLHCCGSNDERFLCAEHKRRVDRFLMIPGDLTCLHCHTKPAPAQILIRPLNGGDQR